MKRIPKKVCFYLVPLVHAVLIAAAVLMFICPVSCRMTEKGIHIIEGDYTSPVINSFSVTGERSVRICFSKQIKINALLISGNISAEASYSETEDSEECIVDFNFSEAMETGIEYELYGEAEDMIGNTLTFGLPFTGYNGEIPDIVISEIHPMYTSSNLKTGKVYKCEFIELKALSDGNLSGLEIYSAYDGSDKAFRLPAVRVTSGEYIVIHLRSRGDGCISELDGDFTLSTAKYSCNTARDIWDPNENARLGDREDVILLRNTADGSILDAAVYAASGTEAWKNESIAEAAALAAAAGKWFPDAEVSSAAVSDSITASKTLTKNNLENNCASSWSVTESSAETPGF